MEKLQILRSDLKDPDAFEKIVKLFIDDVHAWEKRVDEVKSEEGIPDDKKTFQIYPAPSAPEVIMRAIKKVDDADGKWHYEPNYEIVDVIPIKEGETDRFEDCKAHLRAEIVGMQKKTFDAIHSPSSVRLANLKAEQANIEAIPLRTKREMAKRKDAEPLTEAEEELLSEKEAIVQIAIDMGTKQRQIDTYFAEQLVAVDDLTYENINTWAPTPMPEKI